MVNFSGNEPGVAESPAGVCPNADPVSVATFVPLDGSYNAACFGQFREVATYTGSCVIGDELTSGVDVITWSGRQQSGPTYKFRAAIGVAPDIAELSVMGPFGASLERAGRPGNFLFYYHSIADPHVLRWVDLEEIANVPLAVGGESVNFSPSETRRRSNIVIAGLVKEVMGARYRWTDTSVRTGGNRGRKRLS